MTENELGIAYLPDLMLLGRRSALRRVLPEYRTNVTT